MLQNALLHIANSKDALLIYQGKKFSAYQLGVRCYEIVEILLKMQCQNQRVAFCLPNSPELLCWYLACIHLGLTIVPITFENDPKYIEEALLLSEPAYFFTTSRKKEDLAQIRFPRPCKIEINDDTYKALYKHIEQQTHLMFNPDRDLSKVDPKSLALIVFSTGADGKLKGIMHSYQSAYSFIDMLFDVLAAKEHIMAVTALSLSQMAGIAFTLIPLLKNGTVILLEHFEVRDYLETLLEYQPTHIKLKPKQLESIINYPNLNKKGFEHVITCFTCENDIPAELPVQFHEKTGAPIQTGYGMAETGVVTVNRTAWLKNPRSCGQRIPFASIDLRDEATGFVKIGDIGEIWIKSPALCLGYWNKPELNQKLFVNGWFRTNDLAMLDKEGFYWYKGQKMEIIHRGQRFVYPQTIEQTLFNFPQVKTCVVIGIPDSNEGEVPIVFVELKEPVTELSPNKETITESILKFCQEHLASYNQPKKVFILDKLPLDLKGNIDIAALKKRLQQSI